jgi:RNA ligase (TIGR02306 family)
MSWTIVDKRGIVTTCFPYKEGDDLTEILGVKLYEKPLPRNLAGKVRGNFPSFISKTDQERVQNILKYLPEHFGRKYQATLKLDGSSMTIYARSVLHGIVLGEFGAEPTNMTEIGVCSRNLDLKLEDETSSLFLRTFRDLGLEEKLRNLQRHVSRDIAVQGEMMGPGIQGNRERLEGLRFFVFDVYDITTQRYLDPISVKDLADAHGFDHVPVIDYINLENLWDDSNPVSRFLEYADRKSLNHDIAEGVVFKAVGGERHSFKAINNVFLLKEKD